MGVSNGRLGTELLTVTANHAAGMVDVNGHTLGNLNAGCLAVAFTESAFDAFVFIYIDLQPRIA